MAAKCSAERRAATLGCADSTATDQSPRGSVVRCTPPSEGCVTSTLACGPLRRRRVRQHLAEFLANLHAPLEGSRLLVAQVMLGASARNVGIDDRASLAAPFVPSDLAVHV